MLPNHKPTPTSKTPKVSVCVVTYNQEKYIRQCLQSLVDQKADFKFVVIVADDFSTDGTRSVIREFEARYPSIIKPSFRERNMGPSKNYLRVHEQPITKYIAHMDGDDYALPGKLQGQVDFLDVNESCSVVCHRTQTISEDGCTVLGYKPAASHETFTDLEGLLRQRTFFDHSSKMYRRSANVFDHSHCDEVIDFFVHVEHASVGLIGYLPETLGAHRINCAGITAGSGAKLYKLLDLTLDGFERARELGVNDKVVNLTKARYLIGAAGLCLSRGDADGCERYLSMSRISGRYVSLTHGLLYLLRRHRRLMRAIFHSRALVVGWYRKSS